MVTVQLRSVMATAYGADLIVGNSHFRRSEHQRCARVGFRWTERWPEDGTLI